MDLPPISSAYLQAAHDFDNNADNGCRLWLAAGLRSNGYLVNVTYSDLVAKPLHARTDELTPTAGYRVTSDHYALAVTAGACLSANYGGSDISNQWHRTVGVHAVHDPYVTAHCAVLGCQAQAAYLVGPINVNPILAGIGYSCGGAAYDASYTGSYRRASLGVGYAGYAGKALTPVAGFWHAESDGWHADASLTFGHLTLGVHVARWSDASVTWSF